MCLFIHLFPRPDSDFGVGVRDTVLCTAPLELPQHGVLTSTVSPSTGDNNTKNRSNGGRTGGDRKNE